MDNAACACLSVEYSPVSDGKFNRDRWVCSACGRAFHPAPTHPNWGAEIDRLLAESAEQQDRITELEREKELADQDRDMALELVSFREHERDKVKQDRDRLQRKVERLKERLLEQSRHVHALANHRGPFEDCETKVVCKDAKALAAESDADKP